MTRRPWIVHPFMCQDRLNFLVKPFGSTVKNVSVKEVEARSFYGLKVRMYVRIGFTAVTFRTIINRKIWPFGSTVKKP
jgi:hypothetical protein